MNNGSKGGDDHLISAASITDRMWGDFQTSDGTATGGHDTFVFGPSNGNDHIYDFHHGEDHIELDGVTEPAMRSLASRIGERRGSASRSDPFQADRQRQQRKAA